MSTKPHMLKPVKVLPGNVCVCQPQIVDTMQRPKGCVRPLVSGNC